MGTRIKCLIALIALSILEIGPVPIMGAIGVYVVIFRPQWFKNLVDDIYRKRR